MKPAILVIGALLADPSSPLLTAQHSLRIPLLAAKRLPILRLKQAKARMLFG
ncbi:MAG: hypothetical protein KatS3mg105_2865 [Gemmatales bacterium]|nr:MAG: hypothetical protein KatS3mg105_2865 [Gemmatales bacterium]